MAYVEIRTMSVPGDVKWACETVLMMWLLRPVERRTPIAVDGIEVTPAELGADLGWISATRTRT